MNTVPANVSGLLISLEPVIGVIMAVLILGEHLSTMSAIGITVVIVSTFVTGMLARVSNKHKNAV
jgi:putative membrane protein